MPIRVLSDDTINKIAAGEVVERPANAVKELVENAIDAGATSIEVTIGKAGKQLIRVTDNGCGMSADDLSLAVTRHATSKISEFSDLSHLSTLGFRGEALPSIAAVSRLRIQSQQPDSHEGRELYLEGGRIKENRAWAGARGTTVEVSQLFFNTPARDKFLKSDMTERSRILRTLEETALSHPSIAFTAISEGKKVLSSPPAASDRERIIDILGSDLAAGLIEVDLKHPRINVKAYVSKREKSVSTRDSQFLFINRRPVSLGKLLTHSLYEAYRESLQVGRHPAAVIFIDIDPSEVDINIHPAKRDVKFANEREIHDLLCSAVKRAVTQAPIENLPSLHTAPASSAGRAAHPSVEYRPPQSAAPSSRFEAAQYKTVFGQPGTDTAVQEQHAAADSCLKILGQAFGLYVIVEREGEVLIVDQHAAAERVRYEQYLAEWGKKDIPVQPLLFPATLELPPSAAGLLRENLQLLSEAGWGIEEFGANTLRITALPAVLGSAADTMDIINGILQALREESRLPAAEKIERIIRAACRRSIKAGDRISPSEMTALLKNLFACSSPYTCPHGRPTAFKIARQELEKFFGRQ